LMRNDEIVELLVLNVKAAKVSALDSSWEAALSYLENIIPMSREDNHWKHRYHLCLIVNTMYAEVNLSLCNFEATISTVEMVARHGKSIDHTYDAYLLLMRALNAQKKNDEALSIAIDVLDQLGVEADWLKTDASSEKAGFRSKVKKLVTKKACKQLAMLSPIQDKRKLKAIRIFYWLLVASYGTPLHELASGKILTLTLDYGFCEEGINGILTYASGYLPLKKKNDLSRAASIPHEKLDTEKIKHDYCLILGGYLQCWSSPLRDSLATLLEGLKIGNKNGHIDNAAICGSLLCSYSLFSGERLKTVEDTMEHYADWAKEERLYGSSRLGFIPFLQLVKCLQDGSYGTKNSLLMGEEMDAEEMDVAAAKSTMVSCSLAMCKLELACIFGDYIEAGEILKNSPDLLKVRPGHFSGCRFTFYEFLTSAELARISSRKAVNIWSKRADAAQKQIENWIDDGNVNCNHLLPLIKAESAWMKGKKRVVRKHFEQVVQAAESGPNLQDRAISMERAAIFYHNEGDMIQAVSCYGRSRSLYQEWGAYAKVKALDKNENLSGLLKICRYSSTLVNPAARMRRGSLVPYPAMRLSRARRPMTI